MAKRFRRAKSGHEARLWLVVALALLCASQASAGEVLGPWQGAAFGKKSAARAQAPQVRSTLPPTLTIPVEPLGFSAPGAFYLGMRNSLVSLDFLDEDRLLFTFRVPGLIHRDMQGGSSDEREIRAVVLRLPQGAVEAETVWTVHDRRRYLYMLGNGQFLLRDGNQLKIGGPNLELKPYLRFPGPVQWVELDPSGEYLVAQSSEPEPVRPGAGEADGTASAGAQASGDEMAPEKPDLVLRVLRRADAKVMLVSRIRSAMHLPLNQEGYLEMLRGRGDDWTVNFNHFSGGSTILGSVNSACVPVPDFIAPGAFLLRTCDSGGDGGLVAMTTAGRRLWENSSLGRAIWPLTVTNANGQRIARETLVATHGVNASSPLGTDDIKGQDVAVLDGATGKVELRAMASPIFDAGGNVAISPSGRRVAILMEGGMQIFDLPPAPALPTRPEKEASR